MKISFTMNCEGFLSALEDGKYYFIFVEDDHFRAEANTEIFRGDLYECLDFCNGVKNE